MRVYQKCTLGSPLLYYIILYSHCVRYTHIVICALVYYSLHSLIHSTYELNMYIVSFFLFASIHNDLFHPARYVQNMLLLFSLTHILIQKLGLHSFFINISSAKNLKFQLDFRRGSKANNLHNIHLYRTLFACSM